MRALRRRVVVGLVSLVTTCAVVLLGGPVASAEPRYPLPARVVDQPAVLAATVRAQLEGELTSFEDRTGHQLAVVVVRTLGGVSVEAYARSLFVRWGIGRFGIDDGALLLVALEERRVRVQVGPGLYGQLTDDRAVGIVDDLTPRLKAGDYGGGIMTAQRAMRSAVGDVAVESQAPARPVAFGGGRPVAAADQTGERTPAFLVGLVLVSGVAVVVVLVFVTTRGVSGGSGGGTAGGTAGSGAVWGGGSGGAGGGGGGASGGGGGASGGF